MTSMWCIEKLTLEKHIDLIYSITYERLLIQYIYLVASRKGSQKRGLVRALEKLMNEEEVTKLFFSNPEELFSKIKENGGNLDFVENLQLGKLIVRERFPGLIDEKHEKAINFLFWFIYGIEQEVRNSILYVENRLGKSKQETEEMINGMTFGQKIDFVEKYYIKDKDNDVYISFMRTLNKLRNHMAHGRLNELNYGGYFLSEPEAQLKIFADVRNAHLKKRTS